MFRWVWLALLLVAAPIAAEAPRPDRLFRNVRVFDGTTPRLSEPTDELVRRNRIARIAHAQAPGHARVIDGRGRTLMPGLIDVHVHMRFSSMTMVRLLAPDLTPPTADAVAARESERMLLRGFTAVRDVGGPVFGLKAGIDAGKYLGPRIWPSGPTVSQTSGHGDFRLPTEGPRRFTGQMSRAEKPGAG
jgi:imidazolonepropionase-like amidohydrolase